MDELLTEKDLLFACCFAPSIVFWVWSGGLHLCGANRHYTGKVTLSEMVWSQLIVDALQTIGALLRLFVLEDTDTSWRWYKVGLGLLGVDLVEYWLHRVEHNWQWINAIHKRHHRLVPVHTMGTFYNDPRQIFFDAVFLAMLILLFQLTIIEVAIVSSISVFFTVHDHWPSAPNEPLTRHERHHHTGPSADFSQPFTGIWDFVFGTRVKDVYLRKQAVN